jgi:hypothetical protein
MLQEQAALAQAAIDASVSSSKHRGDGTPTVASVGSQGTVGPSGTAKVRKVSPAICASMVEAGTEPKPKGPLLSSSVDSITLTIQPGRGSSRDIAGSAKGDSTPTVTLC